MFVVAKDADELEKVAGSFEGNLTGSIYTDTEGEDDGLYARVERHLRRRVGRLLNDKMPTGVAVTPAMNHGGGRTRPRVHGRWYSGFGSAIRHARVLRQRARAAASRGAA